MDCANMTTPVIDCHNDLPIEVKNRPTTKVITTSNMSAILAYLATFKIPIGTPSPLTEIFYQEYVPLDKLELLLNSTLLKEYTDKWGTHLKNEHEHLKKIYEMAKKNSRTKKGHIFVSYNFSECWNYIGKEAGRIYPKGSLSLGCIRAEPRGFLTEGFYADFDIKNAHPSLLLQIFHRAGIETPSLREYVYHRDTYITEMMRVLKTDDGLITKKRAKQLFIMVIYGGGIVSWMKGDGVDNKPILNYEELSHYTRKFFDDYEKEVKSLIIKTIADNNPEVVAECRRMGKKNPEASTTSIYAQCIERYILETMYQYCQSNQLLNLSKNQRQTPKSLGKKYTRDAILCFDGLMLLREHIENARLSIPEVIAGMEKYVEDKTTFKVVIEEKRIDYGYTNEQVIDAQIKKEPIKILSNDMEFCEELMEKFGHLFKTTPARPDEVNPDDIYVYDEITGKWVNNKDLIYSIVIKNSHLFPYEEKEGVITKYWGHSNKALKSALSNFFTYCRDDAWFSETHQNNSLGKILFQDGWFDFDTKTFHEGFTHDIVFHHKAEIPFNVEWDNEKAGGTLEEVKAWLFNKMCVEPSFEGNKTLRAMLYYLARAIAGKGMTDRFFMMGTGATTAGKGTLTAILKAIFGGYITEINSHHLTPPSKMTEDIDKRLGFLVPARNSRILIAQEQPKGNVLASDLIKKIAGGGDQLEGRKLFKNSIRFQPHGVLLLFNNAVDGAFDTADPAIQIRLRGWRYDKTFVDVVENPENELPKDEDFKANLTKNIYHQRAFLDLLIDNYYNPDKEALEQSRAISKKMSFELDAKKNILADKIIITKNKEDFITGWDIDKLYDELLSEEGGFIRKEIPNRKALKKEIIQMGAMETKGTKGEHKNKLLLLKVKLVSAMEAEEEAKEQLVNERTYASPEDQLDDVMAMIEEEE